jgi:AraC family transcriptional regulator, regulatory protein of adaptative response / methylated-DNA-[protein]-cysteine methyltransferase
MYRITYINWARQGPGLFEYLNATASSGVPARWSGGISCSMPNETRWNAVLERDARADGRFVFAVETTGIYCRPSCPARRPLRKNVTFFDDGAAARRMGFRACKRCHPDGVAARAAMVERVCRRLGRAEELPSLAELARAEGLSPAHFQRAFKTETGLSPHDFARGLRAQRFRHQLKRSKTVSDAIYEAGFNSSGRAYESASLGMTPTGFKQGGAGETIRFAVGECSLGAILVAATARGVCAILLGDAPEPLVEDLQRRFPRAELVGGDTGFERSVAEVVGFVEAPRLGLSLPLDLRGTAFQQRVWKALARLPAGKTSTYAGLAKAIGNPKAVRAVAGAVAANPIAVAIPCHRVIRTDGALSGYRWGVERKKALLAREAPTAPTR